MSTAQVKAAYINLPIKNLQATRNFWTNLGFTFNEDFSDDRALCLQLKPDIIYAMLITRDMYQTFTNRPIADGTTTQVLIAIEVESKDEVDRIVSKAIEQGATKYLESSDEGWMYYDRFVDLDGHQWEVLYSDMNLLQQTL
jgi:predicted lactoylglutathione lyase